MEPYKQVFSYMPLTYYFQSLLNRDNFIYEYLHFWLHLLPLSEKVRKH